MYVRQLEGVKDSTLSSLLDYATVTLNPAKIKTMNDATNPAYDEVPYDSNPFHQSHPDRLATMASLFGMQPPPVETARVLELGCAAGGNLIPHAVVFPDAQLVGVDLSKRQIDDGQSTVDALELTNIDLQQRSIADVDESLGKFDYIISHGVYSWVDNDIQAHILRVCKENLVENGVAYVSYNTYPGWHMRGMLRDMMQYHVTQFNDPSMRVKQARALHRFLSENVPVERNPAYGQMLKNELELLDKQADYYLLHDHLEEVNLPVYFFEFAERAQALGLQYLAEADFTSMLASDFPDTVAVTLRNIAPDIVRTEQFMDFLRNRMFRQTLLVHADVELNRELGPSSIYDFNVASPAKPDAEAGDYSEKIWNSESLGFKLPSGTTLNSTNALTKSAMISLADKWPESIPFRDLATKVLSDCPPDSEMAKLDGGDVTKVLGADLLRCYSRGIIECHVVADAYTKDVSEKPQASPLAKLQALTRARITNLRHETLAIDEFNKHVLQLLDGANTPPVSG